MIYVNTEEEPASQYPKLMKTEAGLFLMKNKTEGTCIKHSRSDLVGHFGSWDNNQLSDFNGIATLRND